MFSRITNFTIIQNKVFLCIMLELMSKQFVKLIRNRKTLFVKLYGEKVKFLNIHRKTTYMSIESNSNLKVKNVRKRNLEFSTVLNFPKPCFLLYILSLNSINQEKVAISFSSLSPGKQNAASHSGFDRFNSNQNFEVILFKNQKEYKIY